MSFEAATNSISFSHAQKLSKNTDNPSLQQSLTQCYIRKPKSVTRCRFHFFAVIQSQRGIIFKFPITKDFDHSLCRFHVVASTLSHKNRGTKYCPTRSLDRCTESVLIDRLLEVKGDSVKAFSSCMSMELLKVNRTAHAKQFPHINILLQMYNLSKPPIRTFS